MSAIAAITGREILDSRGNPALEVEVQLEGAGGKGVCAYAAVPSGASTGRHEALEKRDRDPARYGGKGLLKAVEAVEGEIFEALCGIEVSRQRHIDAMMIDLDGSPDKSRLGANAILGVSLAAAHAAARAQGLPLFRYLGGAGARVLPMPLMNVINGGAHADNRLDVQEFMIAPAGASSFSEALRMGAETFHALKAELRSRGQSVNVGDEGGFAPDLTTGREALDCLMKAIESAGFKPGRDVFLALDVAASELFREERYHLRGAKALDREGMAAYLEEIAGAYPLFSIEDGMAEDDWQGWQLLTEKLGDRIKLVGDDLFATNTERLARGIGGKAANAILVKPNQIGTLTEACDVIEQAKTAGFAVIVSHRSGETEDATIADLAVAHNCGLIKTGSLSRSERTAKYNRLIRIEEMLGGEACYAGPGLVADREW